MIKIGITGSLASGKSTVAKIIASKKYPLFDADKVVKQIYQTKYELKIFPLTLNQLKKTTFFLL